MDVEISHGPPRVSLEDLVPPLLGYLEGTEVERAIVFGAFARGEADAASDLDLVLIERTTEPFLERGRRHLPLFRLGIGIDLLVYTPQEYARLRDDGHPLIERIEREGRTVYARPGERGPEPRLCRTRPAR